MNPSALFGLSVLMSFAAFGLVAQIYLWPALRRAGTQQALLALTVPHTFRFVGLAFLVPGVVSSGLPRAFAAPAAYGDLVAALLAMVCVAALAARARWATAACWIVNVWGPCDLLFAIYQGEIGVRIEPGALGAAFAIPTLIVPPLLILHGLALRLLLTRRAPA